MLARIVVLAKKRREIEAAVAQAKVCVVNFGFRGGPPLYIYYKIGTDRIYHYQKKQMYQHQKNRSRS